MSESDKKKPNRRDFILTASTVAGAVGVGAAAWPLIDQMNPDASVKALASTEVDISGVEPGQSITVLWRGKPVFIKRRTQEEIDSARCECCNNILAIKPRLNQNKRKYNAVMNSIKWKKLNVPVKEYPFGDHVDKTGVLE